MALPAFPISDQRFAGNYF